MKNPTEEAVVREQNRDYERRTNRVVGCISVAFMLVIVLVQLLMKIDFSENVTNANRYVFFPLDGLLLVFFLLALYKKFDGAWIKYMLVGGLVLMTTGLFLVFTVYATYFLLLPLVVCIRYFDRRFIILTAVFSIVLFAVACYLNLHMADSWELLSLAHESNMFDPWKRTVHAFVFVIIPLGFTCLFMMFYCFEMTSNGRSLLNARTEAVSRVTRVDTELRMASDIQKSALPAPSFQTADGHFRLEARELSAKEMCGDFYDYYMVNDHTLVVLIADVADKGLPAAMFMMSAKKAIRCAVECCHSLRDAVVLANRLICENNSSGVFLTLFLAILDTRTGVGKYTNAGHPFPLLRSADGAVRPLENDPDLFLGSFPEQNPAVHTFSMVPGDTLLLFTDGITDSMNGNGESFGVGRIEDDMKTLGADAGKLAEGIMAHSVSFADGQAQFDDMTLLALRCLSVREPLRYEAEVLASGEGTKQILDGVETLLREVQCPEDVRRNADVVVDELCANVADYAYGGEPGPLQVSAAVGENCLRLVLRNQGDAFDPLSHADPEWSGEPGIGGLGIYFVKNMTDTFSYRRTEDTNELTVEMVWDI